MGYDVEGRKLEKRGRRDRLEKHIARGDALGKVRSGLRQCWRWGPAGGAQAGGSRDVLPLL